MITGPSGGRADHHPPPRSSAAQWQRQRLAAPRSARRRARPGASGGGPVSARPPRGASAAGGNVARPRARAHARTLAPGADSCEASGAVLAGGERAAGHPVGTGAAGKRWTLISGCNQEMQRLPPVLCHPLSRGWKSQQLKRAHPGHHRGHEVIRVFC
nr:uncharacterized protein LOC108178644 [Oryctolagus cuniculus]